MKKTVVRKRAGGLLPALGIGLAAAVGLTLLMAAFFAYGMDQQWVREASAGYVSAGILILSTAAGALTATALFPQRRLLVSMGLGGGYFLILLLWAALFFHGNFGGLPVTAALICGSAVGAGLLGAGRAGKKKRQYKRYRS